MSDGPPMLFWVVLALGWVSALCWVSGAVMLLRRAWRMRRERDARDGD